VDEIERRVRTTVAGLPGVDVIDCDPALADTAEILETEEGRDVYSYIVGCALDAVSRGLRTALVERDDFASGTSSKSSKLIHGGIRYLQQREFALVYENLRERHRILDNAPHLVRVLPFLIPILTRDGLIDRRIARALGGRAPGDLSSRQRRATRAASARDERRFTARTAGAPAPTSTARRALDPAPAHPEPHRESA